MSLIVQKYGGSSVGSLDRINHIAEKIIHTKQQGHQVIVVVSAMYGETDRLIQLAKNLTSTHDPREYDALISTGEQVTTALLSIALNAKNQAARSYTGRQIGILTDDVHTKARIIKINTDFIQNELAKDHIIIIAGFQGVNTHGDTTTLGRGGSDTTAVAIAATLNADECQIYTDVDGVYTTDPHLLKEAVLLPDISYEEMLEMSSLGAKVLQIRAVELASKYGTPLRVLSSFTEGRGTIVTFEEKLMDKRLVSGIAFNKEEAIISLSKLPKNIGLEGLILEKIGLAQIEVDMIAQNQIDNDTVDFTFTVHRHDYAKICKIIDEIKANTHDMIVKTNTKVAKLSLIGIGMRSHPGITSLIFQTLNKENIFVQMIITSEIKISIIINEQQLEKAVQILHQAFNLDKILKTSQQLVAE